MNVTSEMEIPMTLTRTELLRVLEARDPPKRNEDEVVMFILVNEDLLPKMGKGKIANQCSHGSCRVTRRIERYGYYREYFEWIESQEPKIVLKAPQKLLERYESEYSYAKSNTLWCEAVRDAGRTQIEAGSLTTLCFNPMKRGDAPSEISSLKLL